MTSLPASVAAVLVDANVLYSRVLRDFLLYSADAELITVLWSRKILEEMTRHLMANVSGFTEESATRLIDAMNIAFPFAVVEPGPKEYESLASVELPDEDDRHVIAAALVGEATILCTANLKHFPGDVHAGFGIEVIAPDALLTRLMRDHPAQMIEVHRVARSSLKGGTDESTLAALRRADAPFAADALEYALRVTDA